MNRCVAIAVGTGLACGLAGAGIVALTTDDTHTVRVEWAGGDTDGLTAVDGNVHPWGTTGALTWPIDAPMCRRNPTHVEWEEPLTCNPTDPEVVNTRNVLVHFTDYPDSGQRAQICDDLDGEMTFDGGSGAGLLDERVCRVEFD